MISLSLDTVPSIMLSLTESREYCIGEEMDNKLTLCKVSLYCVKQVIHVSTTEDLVQYIANNE